MNNSNVIQFIVEQCGADIDDIHEDDEYALRYASEQGNLEVVKYLVEQCGADIHASEDDSIESASRGGHLEVVKYFIEKCGIDAHVRDNSLVCLASDYGHLNVLKYLVEQHGVDIHVHDDAPLRNASAQGHLEVVQYLVEHCGANVHARDDFAIHYARKNGHSNVVHYLENAHSKKTDFRPLRAIDVALPTSNSNIMTTMSPLPAIPSLEVQNSPQVQEEKSDHYGDIIYSFMAYTPGGSEDKIYFPVLTCYVFHNDDDDVAKTYYNVDYLLAHAVNLPEEPMDIVADVTVTGRPIEIENGSYISESNFREIFRQCEFKPEFLEMGNFTHQVELGYQRVNAELEKEIRELKKKLKQAKKTNKPKPTRRASMVPVLPSHQPNDDDQQARPLELMKVADLKAMCKERGITGYSRLKKAELVDLLQQ